jgi:uroporphyrin-III C-methyltransferase
MSMQRALEIGKVFLVGAGPGHPDLLTLKGARLIATAEVVVYDALLHPDILALFPPNAELVYAGKRAGNHALSQEAIHELLIDRARKGKRVVRLKGGDPFVFGRGGEEVLALRAAAIPFEVVPGVSALNGVAGSECIPLTHRGCSDSVLVLEGSDPHDATFEEKLAGDAQTIAVFMAGRFAPVVARKAMEAGWDENTPAALVWNGGRPDAIAWHGNLSTLSRRVSDAPSEGPCLIYFGPSIAALEPDASHVVAPGPGIEGIFSGKETAGAPPIASLASDSQSSPHSMSHGGGAAGAGFPIWLRLAGEPVLIVGGGSVALQKIRSLLDSGAVIDIVALAVRPEVEKLHAEGHIRSLMVRPVLASDLDGMRLVISACNDRIANGRVAEWAKARGIWVNSVDDPASCTFLTGAVLERGPLRMAFSTDGKLPGLSGLLRRLLTRLLPESHDAAWEDLNALRARLKITVPSGPLRMGILRNTLDRLESEYFAVNPPVVAAQAREET